MLGPVATATVTARFTKEPVTKEPATKEPADG
jgi:hypothetical protein